MDIFKTLKARLLLICGILSLALIIVGATGYVTLKFVSEYYNHVTTINLPNASSLQDMSAATGVATPQMVRMGYTDLSAQEIDHLVKKYSAAVDMYNKADKIYQDVPFVEGESKLYDEVAKNWKDANVAAAKIIESRRVGDIKTARDLLNGAYRIAYDAHGKALGVLMDFQDSQAKLWGKKAQDTKTQAQQYLIVISVLGFLLGAVAAYALASRLQTDLRLIADSVEESKDSVEQASEQLSAASQQLANSSTEAAASLEETVASIEELSSMVRVNSTNAEQASSLSRKSEETALKGNQEISQLISAMSDINSSSKKIREITNVIDDIAFQTNLLALNAAVEAARAGEQGKGFSVVAEAVRSLAQRSAQAAKEISGLITDSVEKVEKGAEIADRSGESLKEIVQSVKVVSTLNAEISTASTEQSTGIAQISTSMNQLDQATQVNAASAEEAAASSEMLLKQARNLSDQVQNLKAIVG